jgi:ankyrin repeat protein
MREDPYDLIVEALQVGRLDRLDQLSHDVEGFPHGVDSFIRRRWITNAIDLGSVAAVRWMLARTPLHSALDRQRADRYEIIAMLLDAGAPVDLKGVNGWTPAHMAAARDDVEALRLLVARGADLSIRTEIDSYTTPLEEARLLGKSNAVAFLEQQRRRSDGPSS